MKKDSIESRLRRLEERRTKVKKSDDALAYELQRIDVERLTDILIGSRVVTDAERQKVRRFAIRAKAHPLEPVSAEFMDLDVVRQVMDKEESLE